MNVIRKGAGLELMDAVVWYLVARWMIARWIETVRQAKCGVFEERRNNFRISNSQCCSRQSGSRWCKSPREIQRVQNICCKKFIVVVVKIFRKEDAVGRERQRERAGGERDD